MKRKDSSIQISDLRKGLFQGDGQFHPAIQSCLTADRILQGSSINIGFRGRNLFMPRYYFAILRSNWILCDTKTIWSRVKLCDLDSLEEASE